jgi:hypothetical protein
MIEHRLTRGATLAVALSAATWAGAANRTTVTLVGRDDSVPKLGMPGIALLIVSPDPASAAAVRATLDRGLAKLVYTRPLRDGEPGDYALTIRLDPKQTGRESASLPFHAELTLADGRRVWSIDGQTDLAILRSVAERGGVAWDAGLAARVPAAIAEAIGAIDIAATGYALPGAAAA